MHAGFKKFLRILIWFLAGWFLLFGIFHTILMFVPKQQLKPNCDECPKVIEIKYACLEEKVEKELEKKTPEEPEKEHPITLELRECMKKRNYTTSGMNSCSYEACDAWLKEIDKYMGLLKRELPPEQYKLLETSQSNWKEYQKSEQQTINEIIFNLPGTIHTNYAAGHNLYIIEERAKTLENYYSDVKDRY